MIATPDAATHTQGSFRDPAGSVFQYDRRIVRVVHPGSIAELEEFLMTKTACEAVESGALVRSRRVSPRDFPALDLDGDEAVFEHERYPLRATPTNGRPKCC